MMMMMMMMMKINNTNNMLISIPPEGAGCQLSQSGHRTEMGSCVSLIGFNPRRLKAPFQENDLPRKRPQSVRNILLYFSIISSFSSSSSQGSTVVLQ